MMAGVGASAILDQLIAFFCDPGEEVLIATPYYNGFDNGEVKFCRILQLTDTNDEISEYARTQTRARCKFRAQSILDHRKLYNTLNSG